MNKAKKLFTTMSALFSLILTGCKTTPLTEQYLKDPVLTEQTLRVELAQKKEESWTNVFKTKATTVGVAVAEHGFTDSKHKAGFDAYLRYNDRLKNHDLVEKFGFKYEYSGGDVLEDLDNKPEPETTTEQVAPQETDEPEPSTEVAPEVNPAAAPEETDAPSTEAPSTETSTETAAPSTEAPSTEAPTETAAPSTEAPSTEPVPEDEASKYLAGISEDYFSLSYMKTDKLAVAFSFDFSNLIESIEAPTYAHLYDLKLNLQKWKEMPFLGGTSYKFGVVRGPEGKKDFKAVLAVSATASFNKKSEEVFLVPGKTIAYTLDYFSVLTEMNKVEASYSVYYKDSDGAEKSAKIDFDKTVFMNSAEPVEGEDVFNVYGKTNLVIRQTEKE